jgi:hypothetical protein
LAVAGRFVGKGVYEKDVVEIENQNIVRVNFNVDRKVDGITTRLPMRV